ncbi:glucose-1-phosphate cytidylyltransferase [Pseudofrankia asymbiotica]|uniref:Glucose-1-phosphate cytidylyltransferase n=1 Tax=Pseudofrankia asymbiotica TaxID=1834516 RepID=A0A1V2IKM8_9ACTN|nr:glucose-1-phosphate cytidylyltransferase [Pseudofrankia asymbiotica]ONH33667.1 glucose-1-phosphate cytidylyltransferase [Pseudofrankia asymbiotica]
MTPPSSASTPARTVPGAADIPVVILCGGMGTRLREASEKLPKPLVDIGGKPILWHIMKTYGHYGFRRFVLCLGYKSDAIKNYFLNYREQVADFTLRLSDDHTPTFHNAAGDEDWEVTFAETGLLSGTGARLGRVREYLDGPRFLLTYGDGVGEIDVAALYEAHERGGRMGTVTGVRPSSRYGELETDGDGVRLFAEKPPQTGWVSGGYFVFEREFVDKYVDDDPGLMLERYPLQQLARDRELTLYPHDGFWMGMDTFRDWTELNQLWDAGTAPWRVWAD